MSSHLCNMMVRWAVMADSNIAAFLDELKLKSFQERKNDPRVQDQVRKLKESWSRGSKIERLAVLGWTEHEAISVFCSMIDSLDKLRAEYAEAVAKFGNPSDLTDANLRQYEKYNSKLNRRG